MAAHDICFTNKYHSMFFMFGKCIPVVRGAGVYQPAVDLCIEKLSAGDWVHIFPEGKVNMTKEKLRFKWGIGRILYESPVLPIIVPIWHMGMDTVLPNEPPYVLRFGKKVTINVGQPIEIDALMADLKGSSVSAIDARKVLTDKIQEKMMVYNICDICFIYTFDDNLCELSTIFFCFQVLRDETECLHAKC